MPQPGSRVGRVRPSASAFALVIALAAGVFLPPQSAAQVPVARTPLAQAAPGSRSARLASLAVALVLPDQASSPAASSPEKGSEREQEVDPTEAFRHSPAVRWIARITGLTVDQAYWLCMFLNFVVVFGGLWLLLRKSVPALFRSRGESIRKRIEEAREASREAHQRWTEVEGRLSRLDAEIASMRGEANENGQMEEKRVLAAAEEERRRIVSAAEQEIAISVSAARRELKSYAAGLAVDLAARKIQVGKDEDQLLVREFTSQLGKDVN